MWTVSACLAPAGLAGIYIFGFSAFWVILSCLAGAVLSEYVWQKLNKKPVTIRDGSAFLTGLLLAYNLPPGIPLWAAFLGSAFAVIIVKHLFGGLGNNIFNPALAARGFLLMSWPDAMTTWWKPFQYKLQTDAITTATPLAMMKSGHLQEFLDSFPTVGKMFSALLWGSRGGCLGETCSVFLILGGIFLIYKKYIDWQIPAVFMGTVGILSLVFYNIGMKSPMDPISTLFFSLFSGGLVLGAFFMATDYVTCPITLRGRIIFALGCGVLTAVIRRWGGLPEGVCYSILIMNAFVPLIDSKIRTTVYGTSVE
ncbi:MAG: RnfABCDGE type electron transport complex subunit D [Firmicutes bacterium]|nr:RnfABCDGE type electron transport complex subunit D [Bacillota bacterium]